MSAQFIVTFRGLPVRFTYATGKTVWGIVPLAKASLFVDEAGAWLAAYEHNVSPETDCAVIPAGEFKGQEVLC